MSAGPLISDKAIAKVEEHIADALAKGAKVEVGVEDVIELAHDAKFGLAPYFFAKDMAKVFRVAEALEYGMVGINTGMISTELAPF